MRALAFAPLVLAAACAVPTPRPTEISFAPNGDLTVFLSDRQRCTAVRTVAQPTGSGWQGQLAGCEPAYFYEVALEPNVIRSGLGQILGFFPGMGEVIFTDGIGGRWVFEVPPPLED